MTGLASVALLGAVSDAGAATRYAAAGSTTVDGACASATPGCRLDYAINSAAASDVVVVQPGDYDVTWALAPMQRITVQGQAGQARPRLIGAAGRTGSTLNMSVGGTLSHVDISSAAAHPAFVGKDVTVSQVVARAQSRDAADIKAGAGTMVRDSLFETAAGSPYAALKLNDDEKTGSLDIVNVTAIGTASGSTGIANGSGGPVTIVNTIARGGTNDIARVGTVDFATVSYSNFRLLASSGVTEGAGNKIDAPLFEPGGYTPAEGSPTIDTGTASVTLGPDLDGTTRGAPDMGAYEFGDGGTPPVDDTGDTGDGGSTGGDTGGSTGDTGGSTGDTGGSSGGTGDNPGGATGAASNVGGATMTGGSSTSGAGGGPGDGSGTTPTLPPPAPPVLGESVGLGPVKGTVTVRLPGTGRGIALAAGASVPVGSVIDATRGVVLLTSVRDKSGKTQKGRFWGGVFKVTQSRRGDAYTNLTLAGAAPRCAVKARVNAAARRRWSRRLWARDRGGRFRTRGRHGSATVRGTEWYTEDRCNGTYFRVKKGKIVVRDKAKRKNVTLKRGKRYLARARR